LDGLETLKTMKDIRPTDYWVKDSRSWFFTSSLSQ